MRDPSRAAPGDAGRRPPASPGAYHPGAYRRRYAAASSETSSATAPASAEADEAVETDEGAAGRRPRSPLSATSRPAAAMAVITARAGRYAARVAAGERI